jgi:NADH-quinone oxidoreductase subunit L
MVTAGVYLTARLFPLFEAAPGALAVIGILGAATSLYAALCALSERDIKKVLAWSTISQLGYMFIGVGAGAPAAAVFHLVTHAFFKALLFLAAGSIIHALHKQDLAAMGGLRRSMPITSLALMVGALALMGLPPFSGFFSKDEMLATAFVAGDLHLWLAGMVGAILTAFYAARLTLLALASEPRSSGTPHESPPVMTLPLLALAALALLGGWIAPPPLLGGHGGFSAFLGFGPGVHGGSAQTAELVTMLVSILMVILGGGVAWMLHTRGLLLAPFVRFSPGLQHALEHKLWVDEFYSRWIVRPVRDGASLLWLLVDKFLIDGSLSLLALLVGGAGWALKGLQSGGIARYAALMALVTAATVFWLIRAL